MYRLCYVLLALTFWLGSCSGKDAERAAAGEQSLSDYRDYVTNFEQDSLSETELRALRQAENDSVAWDKAKARMQEEYETQRMRLEENLEYLSSEQQTEADQLDQRYKNSLEARQQQFQDVSHRYKLRRELLGMEVEDDDMSEVTASNIAQMYTRFTSNLQKQADSLQNRDWQLVEGWWSALNSRYRTLEGELSNQTKRTVNQSQNKYKELRPKEDINATQTEKPQP